MSSNIGKTLLFLCNTQCDIACRYCFYTTGHEKRDSQKLTANDAPLIAKNLVSLGFSNVVLTGGDPLSRKYRDTALNITEIFQQVGLKVVINSSGSHITEEDCDRIVEAAPYRIDVSIDSHIEGIHNSLRGRFNDSIRLIKGLIRRGYTSIVTTTVVSGKNAESVEETVGFLRSLGVPDVRIQPVFLPSHNNPELQSLELSLDERLFSRISDLYLNDSARSFYPKYLQWWRRFYGTGQTSVTDTPTCIMGKSMFVSDASGNLSACFHRSDVRLGNLLTDALEDVQKNIEHNDLSSEKLPSCVGKHCVSLFDQSTSWEAN